MIEASIRAMARRLMSSEVSLGRDAYMQMSPEDFDTVTKQLVVSQFAAPCGRHGEVTKITQAVNGFEGVLEGVPTEKRAFFLDTVRRIAVDSTMVVDYDTMPEVQELGKTCSSGIRDLSTRLAAQLNAMCSSDGLLDKLIAELQKEHTREETMNLAELLRFSLRDQDFMLSLLVAASPTGGSGTDAVKLWRAKQSTLSSTKLQLPFDFLIHASEVPKSVDDEPTVPGPYGA